MDLNLTQPSTKKVNGGHKAKIGGEAFENYFKRILEDIQAETDSPIVCFRKHSNEVVGALTFKKMFGMVKKLGYLKGDLDYSITLRGGKTLFVECKSGNAKLTKEQEDMIERYNNNDVPYVIFSQKLHDKFFNVVATNSFASDKLKIRTYIDYMLGK
ncbi:MAG: type I restriction enzyme HsdR N-terminal domain-containing protein [Alphaproteobacteria bacterium]|nr:type I restriction enzyme HsdR N-terminal domain-containing protein [Alphaproteobacteria bacterium]